MAPGVEKARRDGWNECIGQSAGVKRLHSKAKVRKQDEGWARGTRQQGPREEVRASGASCAGAGFA